MAGSLLLAALGYDWLGNVAHEIFGTAMFLLLITHNTFNRRWYGSAVESGRDARGAQHRQHLRSLSDNADTFGDQPHDLTHRFQLPAAQQQLGSRQIHGLAAYWAFLLVSIHLGLRWPLLMAVIRNLLGITRPNKVRTMVLRVIAVAIAVYGIHSWMVIGFGSKLMAEVMLSIWNFDEAALEFFVHHVSIMGLYAFLSYYCTLGIKSMSYARQQLLQPGCHPEKQNTRTDGKRITTSG